MRVNKKNVRIGCLISLVIGLFLPTLTMNVFGITGSLSLFDVIVDIQSLSVLDDIGYIEGTAYVILLIYLTSIYTCILAIFKDSEALTILSGIIVLIYSGLVILGVRIIRHKLAYTGSSGDPFSDGIELVVAYMFNTGIGVGVSFLISLLLLGTFLLENDHDAYWKP